MIPPFLSRSGHFVVNDLVGISLLVAASYKEEKQQYLLITSNLFKAQKLFTMMKSLLPTAKVSMFMADELIRAENLSLSKEMAANRIYALDEIINCKNEIINKLSDSSWYITS